MPFIGGALVVGGALAYFGSKDQASAQQNIAQAQLGQAGSERGYALNAAQPTQYDISALQEQLANYQNTYGLQQAQLQRDISLEQTTNPQLQQLLQGQNAPTLNPYLNIVQQQRQQLTSELARQLGPGWETTTAGQQALQNFDLQSSNQGAQIQQSYLGSMMANNLALGSSVSGQVNQGAQTLNQLSQGIAGGSNAIQQRQIAASEGTSLTPYSGANNIAQLGQGAAMGQFGNQLLGAGTTLGTLSAYKSLFGNQGIQPQGIQNQGQGPTVDSFNNGGGSPYLSGAGSTGNYGNYIMGGYGMSPSING